VITVTTNIKDVTDRLIGKLKSIVDQDQVVRIAAAHMAGVIRERIHEDGKKADGGNIGTYSKKYLKQRRKKGRTGSNKVVISFNRDMENDWGIGQTSPIRTVTGWGLGFRREDRSGKSNFDKSQWMEDRYGKIWDLTAGEHKELKKVVEFEVKKRLK
jgi:hypothetical protein